VTYQQNSNDHNYALGVIEVREGVTNIVHVDQLQDLRMMSAAVASTNDEVGKTISHGFEK
jgi:hypothetical protein